MSKKYFHPNAETWLNDPKIKIKIEDANKYVLNLSNDIKFDAILMDTTDPEIMLSLKLFQKDFFLKLKNHHMNPDTFILMQYGLLEEQAADIYDTNVLQDVRHPKSSAFFKTKVIIKYTPEYIGHTLFYKMKLNPNHTHFIPISEPLFDFKMKRNPLNNTYGTQLTLIKNEKLFPKSNFFNVTMFDVSFDKISNKKEFQTKILDIIEFTGSEGRSKQWRNDKFFRVVFEFEKDGTLEFISLNKTTISFVFNIIDSEINFHNAIEMIVHYFKPTDYSVVYEYVNMKTEKHKHANYTKGDLVAQESGEYTFIHGAKIIDWIQTKHQKALYFESKELGRGLLSDSSLQMFQNSKNYVDFYYTKINQLKPKNILIIGGSDLRVLERISNSDMMESIQKIIMIDNDKKVHQLSKKYLFPNFDEWFNLDKTQLLFEDPNQFILDLSKESNEKFDLVIFDTTSPESFQEYNMFQMDFFKKLDDFHLNSNSMILLHSGYVTDNGFILNYSQKKPEFLKLFNYKTEAVFTPEYTGQMIFYVLTKKQK